MYESERTREEIFIRIKGDTPHSKSTHVVTLYSYKYLFFLTHTTKRYSNYYTVKYNNIIFCLKISYFTTNAVLHIHPLKFFNLVIVHTLDFWYMIKNK